MTTAVIAALPREIAGLVRGWRRIPVADRKIHLYEGEHTVAACAGVGSGRVTLAIEAAFGHLAVERLLSVGLAGACSPGLRAGEVVRCGPVIDVRSGERFRSDAGDAVLVSAPVIAGIEEKHRLHTSYGADVVDMEAATVARLAAAHDLLFGAIRAVSDEATFAMDGLDRFINADGQFREVAFALHTAIRPARWTRAIALGRGSARALAGLTAAVRLDLQAQHSGGKAWM